jgi:hypothetical protein
VPTGATLRSVRWRATTGAYLVPMARAGTRFENDILAVNEPVVIVRESALNSINEAH